MFKKADAKGKLSSLPRVIDFRRRAVLVILHGASSVGKSFTLVKLKEAYPNLCSIEMDDLIEDHTNEIPPDFDQETIGKLITCPKGGAYVSLLEIAEKETIRAQRCIAFLLKKLSEFTADAGASTESAILIVATCGALPFPRYHTDMSVYKWLEDRTNTSTVHILLAPEQKAHLDRIGKRERTHLTEKISANQERRLNTVDRYDIKVSSLTSSIVVIGRILAQCSTNRREQERLE